jgi:hypothetical protein
MYSQSCQVMVVYMFAMEVVCLAALATFRSLLCLAEGMIIKHHGLQTRMEAVELNSISSA